jgi:hypothetical protein
VVAEKTAIDCARVSVLYRRGGTRSKKQFAIHAAEVLAPCMLLCMLNLSGNTRRAREGSMVTEIFEKHCGLMNGEER